MLKRALILLLSANLLAASSVEETSCHVPELSPNQKIMARIMAIDVLLIAANVSGDIVSTLSEGTPVALKALVFPTILGVLALEIIVLERIEMMGFYKRHKWFLYLPGVTIALAGTALAAVGLATGIERASLLLRKN